MSISQLEALRLSSLKIDFHFIVSSHYHSLSGVCCFLQLNVLHELQVLNVQQPYVPTRDREASVVATWVLWEDLPSQNHIWERRTSAQEAIESLGLEIEQLNPFQRIPAFWRDFPRSFTGHETVNQIELFYWREYSLRRRRVLKGVNGQHHGPNRARPRERELTAVNLENF